MNKHYNIRLLMVPAAALALAVSCAASPVSVFYPAPASAGAQYGPKASADDIQIFTNAPSDDVVILGEVSVDGGSGASLNELMAAALGEAMGARCSWRAPSWVPKWVELRRFRQGERAPFV